MKPTPKPLNPAPATIDPLHKCQNCGYWKMEMTAGRNGHCLRFPPVLLRADNKTTFITPTTAASDWCGEWRGK